MQLPPGTLIYDRALLPAYALAWGADAPEAASVEITRQRAQLAAQRDARALQLWQAPIAGFA